MKTTDRIFVAGHRGLVGSAVVRALRAAGFDNLVLLGRDKLDLTDPVAVKWFFSTHRIDYVFLCAACVGGIKDNAANPLRFFLENSGIQTNVMLNAAEYGVTKLLFLGSSCIYPKHCPQPIREEYLLTGPIEPTTEPYALAKINGIRLCQWLRRERGSNFISAMPPNLFGPGDSLDPQNAHIIPGLLRRIHGAKIRGDEKFSVWGSGEARREFLYSEDLARALLLLMESYDSPEPINTGSGFELSVSDLAFTIARLVGYRGEIVFDRTQPTGTPRKVLENSKIRALGWMPEVPFVEALRRTYVDVVNRFQLSA